MLKYLDYLKYFPLLIQLIGFIREAQKRFGGSGSGTSSQKLAWVKEQFIALVTGVEATGLITAKLAKVLRDGAETVISLIVQLINGVEQPAEPVIPVGRPWALGEQLTTKPDFALVRPGEQVWQRGEDSLWFVENAKVSVGPKPAAPWRVVFVRNE